MQSEKGMEIFRPEYRPWPKLHETDLISIHFYKRLERDKEAAMVELNAFTTRVDALRYSQQLQKQLALFGRGILTSLQRTMGNYLKVRNCCLVVHWSFAHLSFFIHFRARLPVAIGNLQMSQRQKVTWVSSLPNTFMGTMKTLNEHNASTSTFVMPLQSIPAMKPTAPTYIEAAMSNSTSTRPATTLRHARAAYIRKE